MPVVPSASAGVEPSRLTTAYPADETATKTHVHSQREFRSPESSGIEADRYEGGAETGVWTGGREGRFRPGLSRHSMTPSCFIRLTLSDS